MAPLLDLKTTSKQGVAASLAKEAAFPAPSGSHLRLEIDFSG
jgi:hypothetical protein